MKQDEALKILVEYLGPKLAEQLKATPRDIVEWAETNFYIPETNYPIRLLQHQKAILHYFFDTVPFTTLMFSTVKKSGKTAIGALVARWVAETWGTHNEIYSLANDLEQSRGRIYAKALESIELMPNYDKQRRVLPGQWRIIERDALHLPSGSILRAVSSDYKGEAGSNPTATFWSELWGYAQESSRRLWDELTPVPTRARSIRFVETYAGYEDESEILLSLYKLGLQGRRLTHNDIDWPFEDQPPLWINDNANMVMYWDSGQVARRMPWQTQEYYKEQAAILRPLAFDRLHLNLWTSSVDTFIPTEWWARCYEPNLPKLTKHEPLVLGVDASVSSDCSAIVGVTRNPANINTEVAVRLSRVWYPPKGGVIDYSKTIEPEIKRLCNEYDVVSVVYDAWQLHKLMTDLRNEEVAWVKPFNQGVGRNVSDKLLYDLVRDRRLVHNGDPDLVDHIKMAAAKHSKDEDTKLRIIKKTESSKIDAVVALSMAAFECLRLNLGE